MNAGDHGTTFGGGPVVSAVALHVLNRIAEPRMLAHVRDTGAWLGAELQGLAGRCPVVRAVRGAGFMWGVDVTCPASDVVARARAAGLLVLTAGEHTLRLLPPLVMTRAELSEGLVVLEEALRA